MTRRVGFALCLAAGFLLSCRVVVVPPPPGPPGLPDVATGGRTYAEVLREAERIAAIKDPAKREAARRRQEAERKRQRVEIDWFWWGCRKFNRRILSDVNRAV